MSFPLAQAKANTRIVSLFLVFSACVLVPITAQGQSPEQIDLPRPGDREFILDRASLINEADTQKIKQVADQLLTAKAAPIVVVTVESTSKYAGSKLRIETFSRLLFDQWGVGPQQLGTTPWNYGILLVVSRDDRQSRIELGAGWKRDKDLVAQEIMNNVIIPRFKRGDYSSGITQGVEALDRMARDLQLPNAPRTAPGFHQRTPNSRPVTPNYRPNTPYVQPGTRHSNDWLLPAILIGLGLFTVVSLCRNGSNGFAWMFWSVIFSLLGAILYGLLTNHSHRSRGFFSGGGSFGGSSGGGSFGGGSFGGGFSGGGGASGSW
jgi:uncharacterized protein